MSTITYACGCTVKGRNPPVACPVHGKPGRRIKRREPRLSLFIRR